MRQDSLYQRISDGKPLSPADVDSLVDILGNRCRQKTKNMLRYALQAVPDIPGYGIYERVHNDPGYGWSYCAGQDYRAELPVVRKCLIGR